jgi:hypothetical protein
MNSDINWVILIRTCHGYTENFDIFLNLLARRGLQIGLVDPGKTTTVSCEFENAPSIGKSALLLRYQLCAMLFISLQFVPE